MTSVSLQERKKETRQKHNSEHKAKIKDNSFHLDEPTRKYEQIFLTSHHQIEAIMFIKPAKKIITSFLFLAVSTFWISAQEPDRNVEQRLKDFFTNFETSYANIGKCRLDRYELNHSKKALHVYANANFGYQPFTPENTEAIYRLLKQSLPGPVNYYDITIYADGKPIEELIPNILQKKQDKSRLWQRLSLIHI